MLDWDCTYETAQVDGTSLLTQAGILGSDLSTDKRLDKAMQLLAGPAYQISCGAWQSAVRFEQCLQNHAQELWRESG